MADPDESFTFQRTVRVRPGEDVQQAIESAADGTLIEVEPDIYTIGEVTATNRQTVGVVGVGGTPVFRQEQDFGKRSFHLKGDEILLENLEFGGPALGAVDLDMPGTWVARDVIKRGFHSAGGSAFRLASRGGGRGLLERCAAPEVQDYNTGTRGVNGIFVNRAHAGDIEVRDCEIGFAGDNGLYGSPPGGNGNGSVRVVRGIFYNNNISGIRLGSPGSGAVGAVIVNDERAPSHGGDGNIVNQRGFWMRRSATNMVIDNCDVAQVGGNCTHALAVVENAGCQVTNTRSRNDAGTTAMVDQSEGPGISGSGCHITGADTSTPGVPSSVIECKGAGCDEPRLTARESTGGDDGGTGGGGGDDGTAVAGVPIEWVVASAAIGFGYYLIKIQRGNPAR